MRRESADQPRGAMYFYMIYFGLKVLFCMGTFGPGYLTLVLGSSGQNSLTTVKETGSTTNVRAMRKCLIKRCISRRASASIVGPGPNHTNHSL